MQKNSKKIVPKLRDFQIRGALCEKLIHEHRDSEDTLIIEEFGCKDARADVAVVNGNLHCYEIKSGFDKLTRLANQNPAYCRVFDRVTLVVEANHLYEALSVVPKWWGVIEARSCEADVEFVDIRTSAENPQPDTLGLAQMLWKNEVIALLREHNSLDGLQNAPIKRLWVKAAESLSAAILAAAVRNAIKVRGGSGFRQPLFRSDDSSPKPSNSRHSQALPLCSAHLL